MHIQCSLVKKDCTFLSSLFGISSTFLYFKVRVPPKLFGFSCLHLLPIRINFAQAGFSLN